MAQKKMYLTEERGKVKPVFEILTEIAVIAALGLFLAHYLFFSVKTESRSMEPTIQPDSVVFVNKSGYIFDTPKRFDIIAFNRVRGDASSDVLIRRIIALPGETVRISRGVVYVDGKELDVSGYVSEITSDGIAENTILLSENEYFVLGDAPANSEDSRSSTLGPIRKDQIIGRAYLSARSITDFHLIGRKKKNELKELGDPL